MQVISTRKCNYCTSKGFEGYCIRCWNMKNQAIKHLHATESWKAGRCDEQCVPSIDDNQWNCAIEFQGDEVIAARGFNRFIKHVRIHYQGLNK